MCKCSIVFAFGHSLLSVGAIIMRDKSERPELTALRNLLETKDPIWLDTIKPDQMYVIKAHEDGSDTSNSQLSIVVSQNGDVILNINEEACTFRYIKYGENQRVRNALLILAENIRSQTESMHPDVTGPNKALLSLTQSLLGYFPWPPILEENVTYSVLPNEGWPLSVMFDHGFHIRISKQQAVQFGSVRTYSAMMMLAVAIKLDTTRGLGI